MYNPYHDWGGWQDKPEKSSRRTGGSRGPRRILRPRLPPTNEDFIHPLVLCPPIARGKRYLLIERTWWGQRNVLKVGRARSPHESLNLARVRQAAAKLGACEVHMLPC